MKTVTFSTEAVHNVELEKWIINKMITDVMYREIALDMLNKECFHTRMSYMFEGIKDMVLAGEENLFFGLPKHMKQHYPKYNFTENEFLDVLSTNLPADANGTFEHECMYLIQLSKRRLFVPLGLRCIDVGTTELRDMEEMYADIQKFMEEYTSRPGSTIATTAAALEELHESVQLNKSDEAHPFDYSGIRCFDERAFLRPQALTTIAAPSGHGKSCLATTIAYNVGREGVPMAYYSMEMDKKELVARMISGVCNIPTSTLLYGKLSDEETSRFVKAEKEMFSFPIYFDEEPNKSADSIYMSLRQMVRKKKIHGAVIDYLQILPQNARPKNETEEQFLAGVVRNLKNLAKQLNIWIILLSQISRSSETEVPTVGKIRGSGQILEGSDNCVILYRPLKNECKYVGINANVDPNGTAELHIAKARNGNDSMRYIVGFDGEHTRFFELDKIPMLNSNR